MTSNEWAVAITAIACALAKGKTSDEIEYLALLFSQLSSTLATLAAAPPYLLQQAGGASQSSSEQQTGGTAQASGEQQTSGRRQ